MPVDPPLYEIAWAEVRSPAFRLKLGEPHYTRKFDSRWGRWDTGDYWAYVTDAKQRILLFWSKDMNRLYVYVYPWDTAAALSELTSALEDLDLRVEPVPDMLI